MTIKLLSISLLITLCLANLTFANDNTLFDFEISRKATAVSIKELKKGDILKVTTSNLKENEQLILQRCGNPCNTAKLVAHWSTDDFEQKKTQEVTIEEPGIYYFWIQRKTEKNEFGPVFGCEAKLVKVDTTSLLFESGSLVYVTLTQRN